MTKISRNAATAFCACKRFASGKTHVAVKEGAYYLLLHGNAIARIDMDTKAIEITTAGWNTTTTKARLNALPGVRVTTRNFELFLNNRPWDGSWVGV